MLWDYRAETSGDDQDLLMSPHVWKVQLRFGWFSCIIHVTDVPVDLNQSGSWTQVLAAEHWHIMSLFNLMQWYVQIADSFHTAGSRVAAWEDPAGTAHASVSQSANTAQWSLGTTVPKGSRLFHEVTHRIAANLLNHLGVGSVLKVCLSLFFLIA